MLPKYRCFWCGNGTHGDFEFEEKQFCSRKCISQFDRETREWVGSPEYLKDDKK